MEDGDKIDEFMLPGFRFHPTDEELVGFYLRRKIQHKPLSIELIKQLDIYKYDPWDLPKLATTGEKEWYFYCPRDRKYRNSARPNRVTGAGFWKATGTDRPIYSSSSSSSDQGSSSKCIGLKKSLVFYKGRAAKGIKTDWMMHEFRLPSLSDSSNKRSSSSYLDKNIPPYEAWAICRIFKKANSNTQRALSHSWVSPVFDNITTTTTTTTAAATISDMMINPHSMNNIQFSSSYITMANKTNTSVPLQFGFYNDVLEQSSIASTFSPIYFPPCNNQMENNNLTTSYTNTISSSKETTSKCRAINDASSLLLDMSTSIFGDFGNINGLFMTHEDMQGNVIGNGEEGVLVKDQSLDEEWGTIRSFAPNSSFPLSYPEALKSNLLMWDSSSPCPSELSTSYSTNKSCYSTT